MENPIRSLELLTRLRVKGVQLSIDDFGTGYSSMVQLVRLPFSEIKVDRSFVIGAMRSAESRAVIKSIVDLGHSLGLRTTAEGVEDRGALDFLTQITCDLVQGYYISRPMAGPAAVQWVAAQPGIRQAGIAVATNRKPASHRGSSSGESVGFTGYWTSRPFHDFSRRIQRQGQP